MALDLCLDDFNDEDLSDILQDKELHQSSYANDSFKVAKRRAASRRGRAKRTTSDSVLSHSNLNYNRPKSMFEVGCATNRRPRPTTLRFFAEPARPGPLVKQEEQKESEDAQAQKPVQDASPAKEAEPENTQQGEAMSRLRESYSEETIKNNNTEQSQNHTEVTPTNSPTVTTVRDINTNVASQKSSELAETEQEQLTKHMSSMIVTQPVRRYAGLTRSASEWSIEDPDRVEYCYVNGELKEQTHAASFKFVPRHADEIHLEINDPLHVFNQADDFWYEGINMRTGQQGIFPAYYAQSLFEDGDDVSVFSLKEENCEKFNLYFLGSVEVAYHKGNDILCEAMRRVALARKNTLHKMPPAYICLLVNAHGIKMMDQSQMKQVPQKPFSSSAQVKERTHFFQLCNVSFCGQHPRNDKYFAFITRHPDFFSRFACHVFVSETSTRPLAESVGRAFTAFYREFMECAHPAEDIYIE